MTNPKADADPTAARSHFVVRGSRFVPALLVGVAVLVLLANGIEWSERLTQSSSPSFLPRSRR